MGRSRQTEGRRSSLFCERGRFVLLIHLGFHILPLTELPQLKPSGEGTVRATSNRLTVIGAPTSAGAYAPGQEKAPEAFRRHGLIPALERAGWQIRDIGDIPYFRWRPDPGNPKSMNLGAVRDVATAVSRHVARAIADRDAVLVLGGDCTIALGV